MQGTGILIDITQGAKVDFVGELDGAAIHPRVNLCQAGKGRRRVEAKGKRLLQLDESGCAVLGSHSR